MQKTYWFGVLSHVYYINRLPNALVYNTQNGEHIHVKNNLIVSLLEKMHEKKNLGVIEICEEDLENEELNIFAKESVAKNICLLTEKKTNAKPVQLMPILNFQRDIDKLKNEDGRSLGEGILSYLSDVTLHVNGECNLNCKNCGLYDKQFFHCQKNHSSESLSIELVRQLLEQLEDTFIRRLVVTGGDIFLYPYLDELLSYLKENQIYPVFGVYYQNLNEKRILMIKDFHAEIFVTYPVSVYLEKIVSLLPSHFKCIFEITSEDEYLSAESWIEKYKIENYEFRPFFNGNNENFFSSNIFLTMGDILSTTTIQRIIFAGQKMNTNFFGALHVYPNGEVKANPSKPTIGNYKEGDLLKIIEKELIENTAWRVIRDQKPCNDCLYQYLCPSPSNYELVFGNSNLCHVIP